MRFLPLFLSLLLATIQWPLWFGDGGWLNVWRLDRELESRLRSNDLLAARNEALAAEVHDLANGFLAIEERARYELSMIGQDEIFVQINDPVAPSSVAPGADRTMTMHARR
ncbi:MAG: cell division protein FtsB [Burkholderiaceae bacterium]